MDNYNYKRDSRTMTTQKPTKRQGIDYCQTPPYALDPLRPYLSQFTAVWEPAAGEGYLTKTLSNWGFNVVFGDIQDGQNFFDYQPNHWDCLVTNPPFSLKFKWLKRCYQLGKPFALLLPVETMGTQTAQKLFREYGLQLILLDKRIDFKMPYAGWASSAQFPTCWYTWGFNLPSELNYAIIHKKTYQT